MNPSPPVEATLTATSPDQTPAPFGDTVLYLRGTMNNWGVQDEFAFQFSCDAYYLNVRLQGRHEFKISDAAWSPRLTSEPHALTFDGGEQTIRAVIVADRAIVSVGPRSFADPAEQPVDDPVALSLRFDSRSAAHKQPFGAVPESASVDFTVSAHAGVSRLTLVVERRLMAGYQEVLEYQPVARVPMQREAARAGERWQGTHVFGSKAVYGYWFEAEIDGRLYVLQNNADAVFWTRERGSFGPGMVSRMPARPSAIRRYRQTVYDPAFEVPGYAADLVYYYIFPDRFRNGDPANDPRPGETRFHDRTVEVHTHWLDQPWKPGSGDGSDDLYNNDFFGGDLAGIIEKLDDIRDLGANAIYMTPIFQAASNHKYDTADYHRIDPGFGTNEDFERLCREAALRGIRMIPDASLNHVGSDSVYFNRYGNHGSDGAFQGGRISATSPYASWFTFDPSPSETDKPYRGWAGVKDLPELDKSSRGWRDFAYGRSDAVMKVWLDRGAAGWRMDVAPWVPDDFWREWRAAIKAHRPDAITIAESWFDSSKYFLGDAFDSTMNYIFRNTVLAYAAGGDAATLYRQLELTREAYPPQAFHALMNLLSSHDQARSLHVLGWTDDADAPAVERARRRFRLALFFQMVFPGAPAIYYGDEVGVTGGDDPYNRAPYPWADLGGQPDLALRGFVRDLIALRHAEPVLRRGSMEAPWYVDSHVIVLARRLAGRWALTATNNAEVEQTVTVPLPVESPTQWTEALGGSGAFATAGSLRLHLPPLGGRVLLAGP